MARHTVLSVRARLSNTYYAPPPTGGIIRIPLIPPFEQRPSHVSRNFPRARPKFSISALTCTTFNDRTPRIAILNCYTAIRRSCAGSCDEMSETLTEPLRARKRPKSKKNAEGGWEKQENVYNMFPRNKRKKEKKTSN